MKIIFFLIKKKKKKKSRDSHSWFFIAISNYFSSRAITNLQSLAFKQENVKVDPYLVISREMHMD
jgi:hypothetical protein